MASMPLMRVLESCSLMTMKGLPYSSKARLIPILKRFKYNCTQNNFFILPSPMVNLGGGVIEMGVMSI